MKMGFGRIATSLYFLSGGFLCLCLCLSLSCSTPSSSRSESVDFGSSLRAEKDGQPGEKPNRATLEDAMLRFEGQFTAAMNDAFRPLRASGSESIRTQSKRQLLLYSSSALDIALGPIPEQNLLDMVVFVELIHEVFKDHWYPEVFGEKGQPVLVAIEKMAQKLDIIAEYFLSPAQLAELKGLAENWHERNPNIVAVEAIRLAEFSTKAGARAKQIEDQVSGILAPVKGATIAADRALSLGERGLHYAQRAPFLFRMQSSLAVQEIMSELEHMRGGEIQALLTQSKEVLDETHKTLQVVYPLVSGTRSFFIALLGVGAALILFGGVVYVVSKLTYERLSKR